MDSDYRNWAVLKSIASPQGNIVTAECFIEGVPKEMDYNEVRALIDNAGLFYGDGGVRWGNRLLQHNNEWILGVEYEFGDRVSREHLYFSDLLEQSRNDKRINLRLAPSLFGLIQSISKRDGTSMNTVIVQILEAWENNRPIDLVKSRRDSLINALSEYTVAFDNSADNPNQNRTPEYRQKVISNAVGCLFEYKNACSTFGISIDPTIIAVIPPTVEALEGHRRIM